MKKTYNKEELQVRAQEVFKQYPNAQEVYATSDGNVFLMENRAKLHAGKGNVISFVREFDADEEEQEFDLNSLTRPELVDFAKENKIDLGKLTVRSKKDALTELIFSALEKANTAEEVNAEKVNAEEVNSEEVKAEEVKAPSTENEIKTQE